MKNNKLFNSMFSTTQLLKKQRELMDKLLDEDEEEKIKKGIEKTKVDNENIDTSSEKT